MRQPKPTTAELTVAFATLEALKPHTYRLGDAGILSDAQRVIAETTMRDGLPK